MINNLLATLTLLLLATVSHAGGLLVHPLQVELDERSRSVALTVINSSDEDVVLRVAFEERVMNEYGELQKASGQDLLHSASPMLRFSPRQVSIPAGGSQVVRVLYRRPKDLQPGEYHSHMTFSRLPTSNPARYSNGRGLSIQLDTILGISIPVFIQHGKPQAQVAWVDAERGSFKLRDGTTGDAVRAQIKRTGNASSRGTVQLIEETAGGGSKTLAQSKYFFMYPEVDTRQLVLPVTTDVYTGGRLALRYIPAPGSAQQAAGAIDHLLH